jgi:MFS transporter, putative metabolite:H+ symporter
MTTFGAESFPDSVRSTATGVAWAFNRIACFLVPVLLLPLLKSSGPMSVEVCVAGALLASAGVILGFGTSSAVAREVSSC